MKKKRNTEWVGGLVSVPAFVAGEGEPYRPEALFWLGVEGTVLGSTVGKPGELLANASASLRHAMQHPACGRPHVPGRVRVSSRELATVLRQGHPGLEVVCAPTPELDALLTAMADKFATDSELPDSYLSSEIGPDAVAAFFHAAAALFRAKPWHVLSSDEHVLSITIEQLGVRDAALSIIGQMGESFGLVLFSGIADFEAFLEAADAAERGEEPLVPPHFALNFERGAELSTDLRKEIAEHRWEVASADAYPWLIAVDEGLVARPQTRDDLTTGEALALALTEISRDQEALAAAWKGGEPLVRTVRVQAHAGDIEVTVRAPYGPLAELRPARAVLADLQELAEQGQPLDADVRSDLEHELFQTFAVSEEAVSLSDIHFLRTVFDLAAHNFSATIATLEADELRELVFEVLPRQLSVDADAAGPIIQESRALYGFLQREGGLPQAGACLRVLEGDAVTKLEAALSDSSQFGLAKSLFMAGRVAGFDMDSKQGIEAWMRTVHSQSVPAFAEQPRARQSAARTKKKQRKAARQARKKNR